MICSRVLAQILRPTGFDPGLGIFGSRLVVFDPVSHMDLVAPRDIETVLGAGVKSNIGCVRAARRLIQVVAQVGGGPIGLCADQDEQRSGVGRQIARTVRVEGDGGALGKAEGCHENGKPLVSTIAAGSRTVVCDDVGLLDPHGSAQGTTVAAGVPFD